MRHILLWKADNWESCLHVRQATYHDLTGHANIGPLSDAATHLLHLRCSSWFPTPFNSLQCCRKCTKSVCVWVYYVCGRCWRMFWMLTNGTRPHDVPGTSAPLSSFPLTHRSNRHHLHVETQDKTCIILPGTGQIVHKSGGELLNKWQRPSVFTSALPKMEYLKAFQQTEDIFIWEWIGGRLDLLQLLKHPPRNTRPKSQAKSGNIHSSIWMARCNFSRWLFSYCFHLK